MKVPDKIIQRMLSYQVQKDPEVFEKSILNLKMDKYKHNLEILHICEKEKLSSGLLYMLTAIYDNDEEVSYR